MESSENRSESRIKRLLSTKKAKGILSDFVELIRINKKDYSVCLMARVKKDRLPYKLFQYGSLRLVAGKDCVAICPISTKKSNKIGILEENNEDITCVLR